MDFRKRRQLAILAVVAVLAGAVFFLFARRLLPEPTCFDHRRNQGEEDTDCGGPCVPCALKRQVPLVQSWPPRFFRTDDRHYDIVSEVRNPNFALGGTFAYSFKIFDNTGFLLAERAGHSFIYPGETMHLIENSFATERTIDHIALEITGTDFAISKAAEPDIIAGRKTYDTRAGPQGKPQSRVSVLLVNRTLGDQKNILVNVLLSDARGNAIGVNTTAVNSLASGASVPLEFFWPAVVEGAVDSIAVEPRVSQFGAR